MRLARCALFVIACGGTSDPPQRSGVGVTAIAPQQGADDVIVAQVNGRPVWGSCVTAQSRGKTKQAALDECVAFELLAQESERRGLATDPSVVDATRTALVSRAVEVGFEDRYKSAADMKEILDQHVERNKAKLSRPELRASMYVRLPLTKPLAEAEDPPAKLVELAERLADEGGMMPSHLRAAVDEVFGAQTPPGRGGPEVTEVGYFAKDGLVPAYADPLFAIPDVGRIHPEVVRTRFGWDVIMLSGVLPAKSYTREEAAAEAFPEVRAAYFNVWAAQVARSLGVKVHIDPKQVAKLEEVGP